MLLLLKDFQILYQRKFDFLQFQNSIESVQTQGIPQRRTISM